MCVCVSFVWVCLSVHWTFNVHRTLYVGRVCKGIIRDHPPSCHVTQMGFNEKMGGTRGGLKFSVSTWFSGWIQGFQLGTKWIRSGDFLEVMWETSLHLAFPLSSAVLLGKKAFLRRKEVLFVTEQQDRTALSTWEESLDGNTFPSRSGSFFSS